MIRAERARAIAMPTRNSDASAGPWLSEAWSQAMKADAAQKTMQNSTLTASSRSSQRPTIGERAPVGSPAAGMAASGMGSRHAGSARAASTSKGAAR